MTRLTPVYGHQLTVGIGDGGDPETFAHPATINTNRGFSFSTEVEADEIIDVDDQSLPAVIQRRVRANDFKIDGAGSLNAGDAKAWVDKWAIGSVFNVKGVASDVTVTGPMVITSLTISGGRMDMVEFSVTLEQAGEMAVTATS